MERPTKDAILQFALVLAPAGERTIIGYSRRKEQVGGVASGDSCEKLRHHGIIWEGVFLVVLRHPLGKRDGPLLLVYPRPAEVRYFSAPLAGQEQELQDDPVRIGLLACGVPDGPYLVGREDALSFLCGTNLDPLKRGVSNPAAWRLHAPT